MHCQLAMDYGPSTTLRLASGQLGGGGIDLPDLADVDQALYGLAIRLFFLPYRRKTPITPPIINPVKLKSISPIEQYLPGISTW